MWGEKNTKTQISRICSFFSLHSVFVAMETDIKCWLASLFFEEQGSLFIFELFLVFHWHGRLPSHIPANKRQHDHEICRLIMKFWENLTSTSALGRWYRPASPRHYLDGHRWWPGLGCYIKYNLLQLAYWTRCWTLSTRLSFGCILLW